VRGLTNVDLNLLVPLQALLKYQNVSRAAEALGLSQPAMSNSLRRLRLLLDDPLLVRSGQRYERTLRGVALQERLDALLGAIEEQILERPTFDPADSNRRIVVGASSATTITGLQPLLRTIGRTAPNLSIAIVDLPREPATILKGYEVDLLLVPEHLPVELPRERLYQEDWVLVGSAGNPELATPLSAEALSRLPFAVYEQEGLHVHALQALAAEGIEVRARFVCDNFLTLLHMVEQSDMVTVLQESIARRYAEPNGLVVIDSPVPFRSFGIDMVWNPLVLDDPAIVWLRETLREAWQPRHGHIRRMDSPA
jgi:DNA-binding transcriptional LysR family regulator